MTNYGCKGDVGLHLVVAACIVLAVLVIGMLR